MTSWARLESAYGIVATPRALVGTQVLRISAGLSILYTYVLHYRWRHFLWGPQGVWPFDAFVGSDLGMPLSLYGLGSSPLVFEALFHAGVLAAVAFTYGMWLPITTPLNLVLVWSLHERNPYVLDGGDNILRIALFYLLFAKMDGARRTSGSGGAPPRPSLGGVLHNLAVLAVIIQLCALYLSTGLYKVMGELWQNGTALYYVMRVEEFTWPGYSEALYRNHYFVVAMTYGTLLFEVAFPFLLVNRRTRYLAMAAGVGFHSGIAVFMGLVTFSWTMISLYAVLVTDVEYRRLAAAARAAVGRLRSFIIGLKCRLVVQEAPKAT